MVSLEVVLGAFDCRYFVAMALLSNVSWPVMSLLSVFWIVNLSLSADVGGLRARVALVLEIFSGAKASLGQLFDALVAFVQC
jgi:hypothetical protein